MHLLIASLVTQKLSPSMAYLVWLLAIFLSSSDITYLLFTFFFFFYLFAVGSDLTFIQTVKRLSTMWDTWVRSLGREDSLEKEIATHSSTLAWKIRWMAEPGAGHCPWGRKESGTTE